MRTPAGGVMSWVVGETAVNVGDHQADVEVDALKGPIFNEEGDGFLRVGAGAAGSACVGCCGGRPAAAASQGKCETEATNAMAKAGGLINRPKGDIHDDTIVAADSNVVSRREA